MASLVKLHLSVINERKIDSPLGGVNLGGDIENKIAYGDPHDVYIQKIKGMGGVQWKETDRSQKGGDLWGAQK